MNKIFTCSITLRTSTSILLMLSFLFTSFAFFPIYSAAAATTIPNGSVISEAKNSFLSNNGVFSDWGNPSSGFKVDSDYSYRLAETSSTQYMVFGEQSYNDGISVAESKGHLSNTVKASAIFSVKSNSANKHGKIGFTATNLKIWNPNKRSFDYLDMKVTVRSWELTNGSNNYIYIQKNPKTTIYISDVNEALIGFEYFYAGTSTPYSLKGNLTYSDIDDYQYVGFTADKTARQYVAADSLLNFSASNGKFIYYRNGPADSTGTPRLAAGISFETDNLEIIFGNNRDRANGNKWAMFSQYAESMGLVEPPEPYKTVSDSDENDSDSAILVDVEERFVYRVSQRIPAGMSEDMFYTSYLMQDNIDSCLEIEDIKILQNMTTDRSDWFTIQNTDNNVLATALPEILKSNQFYGGNQKDDSVLTLEIQCVINPKKTREDFVAHNHIDAQSGEINIHNIGNVIINDSPASTNEVLTRVGIPDLIIEKTTDRYEYQVGETIEYCIDVYHSEDSLANAIDVIVKDVDLPEWIKIDESTVTASGISAPFAIETTGGGIILTAEKIDLDEKCRISFSGIPTKELNGSIIPNTASVIAYTMPDEKSADASVYINSPKLNITKNTNKDKVKKGDLVTYELALTQLNPGTFMRNIHIEDRLPDSGVKLHEDSIKVFDSEYEDITDLCEINVSGSSIKIVPHVDMAYDDLIIPPREDKVIPYDALSLESIIYVTYDVSITGDYNQKNSITNYAVSPATENTNGDVIKEDLGIPSGGDETEHTIEGIIESIEIVPEEPAPAKLAETGDGFNPIFFALVVCVSGAILVALLILRKRIQP